MKTKQGSITALRLDPNAEDYLARKLGSNPHNLLEDALNNNEAYAYQTIHTWKDGCQENVFRIVIPRLRISLIAVTPRYAEKNLHRVIYIERISKRDVYEAWAHPITSPITILRNDHTARGCLAGAQAIFGLAFLPTPQERLNNLSPERRAALESKLATALRGHIYQTMKMRSGAHITIATPTPQAQTSPLTIRELDQLLREEDIGYVLDSYELKRAQDTAAKEQTKKALREKAACGETP